MGNILLAFVTGLTSGGLSCATVQGGLIASAVSETASKHKATTYFLLSKLVVYTLVGAILGAIGQAFTISPSIQGLFQIMIGIYMLATAARILNIHPIFRYTLIKPPLFLMRIIRKYSKNGNDSLITPVVLGAATILIPCGVTQAMLLLSVGSGSYFNGGLIMMAFTLGTMPIFYIIGLTAEKIFQNNVLSKIAVIAITIVGLVSINNGQVLRGSVHTFQNYYRVIIGSNDSSKSAAIKGKYQEVEITVTNGGYKANVDKIKNGVPVKLILKSDNVQSCARSFIIPSLGISQLLPVKGTTEVEFTPTKTGNLTFSCGMGMYTGSFNVVE